jgi:hypothetical protein
MPRYPNTWAIDVVNEPIKTALPWKAALGGDGTTGWDWVITAFQIARTNCPNAKLLINEYGTENDPTARATYKSIINLLKARGLIDGIGIQSHYFNLDSMNRAAVTSMLDDYATLGLDVLLGTRHRRSRRRCGSAREVPGRFPGFWEHSAIKGITLWATSWARPGAMARARDTAGVERPAMTWLKGYVSGSSGGDTQPPSVPAGHGAVDYVELDLARVDAIDGQRRRDGLPDPASAGRVAHSHRLALRPPRRSPIPVSRPAPPSVTRCVLPTRRATFQRCLTRSPRRRRWVAEGIRSRRPRPRI